jgi:nucleoside-diphosphate-sugar epimerase
MTNQAGGEDTAVVERFAVTGAGGFIGGQLASMLLKSGHEVIAVVRQTDQAASLQESGAIVRVADVTDLSQLEAALAGATGIFHMAALFNHPDRTWDDYREVNVQGTINVLTAARILGIKRVVHCSTVGVATEAEAPPYSEETPYSPQPDDKYEVSKCEAEQAARKYADENGTSLSVIRPAQVYGPGDKSKVKFYKLVKKGIIVAPGKTRKHLIYIDDLCRAFELAMITPAANGEVFLIAGAKSTALKDLVAIAAETLGAPYPKIRLPALPVTLACAVVENTCNLLRIKPVIFKRSMDFFTRTVECQTDKAKSILGFESRTSVKDGVEATVRWYKSQDLI